MDELHDGDILQEILDKKDATIYALEEHVELLKARLWNEQLKNENLYKLLQINTDDKKAT